MDNSLVFPRSNSWNMLRSVSTCPRDPSNLKAMEFWDLGPLNKWVSMGSHNPTYWSYNLYLLSIYNSRRVPPAKRGKQIAGTKIVIENRCSPEKEIYLPTIDFQALFSGRVQYAQRLIDETRILIQLVGVFSPPWKIFASRIGSSPKGRLKKQLFETTT